MNRNQRSIARHLALGGFVLVAIALAAVGLFAVGAHQWQFPETFSLRAELDNVGGLAVGSRVRVQGIDAGVVEQIVPPSTPGQPVSLQMRVDRSLQSLIRQDALARVETQGIVGSKIVEITPGTSAQPPVRDGSTIAAQPALELTELVAQARATAESIEQSGRRAAQLLARLDGIAERVEEGEGTLGQLVASDEAHRTALDVMRDAQQAVDRLETLLAGVEQGEGTLGKLTTSDEAHEAALEMMASGE